MARRFAFAMALVLAGSLPALPARPRPPTPPAPVPAPVPVPAPAPAPAPAPVPGTAVANDDPEDDRLVPLGARAAGTTSVTLSGNVYRFRFTGDDTIEYQIDRAHADFAGGAIRITEATTGALLMRGGEMFRHDATVAGFWTPVQAYQNLPVTLLAETLQGDTLLLDYQHSYQGITHQVRYEITLEGKSLRIRARSLTPQNLSYANNYYGFTLGIQSGMPGSKFVWIPYMENVPITAFGGAWFFSTFVDPNWSRSGFTNLLSKGEGTSTPSNFVFVRYNRMSDGTINAPADDTAWVTISSCIEDTFVDTDRYPASPQRPAAASAAVVRQTDQFGFEAARDQIQKMAAVGFYHAQQYLWDWQYNNAAPVNDPSLYPPGPLLGTQGEFQELLDTCASLGWPVGLYTTMQLMDPGYTSSCPVFNGEGGGNPQYDPRYLVRDDLLVTKKGWNTSTPLDTLCGPGLGHATEVLAVNHQPFHMIRELGLMREHFPGITLAYLDARHILPSAMQIDQEAGTDKVHDQRDGILADKTFLLLLRALTGGPLLGEGTAQPSVKADLVYAGYADGIRRRLAPPTGIAPKDWFVLPDYELKVIRPKVLHHGMGDETEYGGFPLDQQAQDTVRCAEICYGHGIAIITNGDVPNDFLQAPDELKAYYQITADLQPRIAASGGVEVRYRSQGSWVDLRQAVFDGLDFAEPQLRIAYDNGLTIVANLAPQNWPVVLLGIPFVLPQDAWVAWDSTDGYLNFSAIVPGIPYRFDYAGMPGSYEMIDGRGTDTTFGTIRATDFKMVWSNGFTVEETGSWPNEFTVSGTLPPPPPPIPPDPQPLPSRNDASLRFRHLQGLFGWIYRARDPSVLPPNASHPYWQKYWSDHQKFFHYPDLDYDAAAKRYSYPNNPDVHLDATTMHPGKKVDVVRGWCAMAPGFVSVSGTAAMTSAPAGGNGVEVRIRRGFEGPILWRATIADGDRVGVAHRLRVRVAAGDVLLFEVDSLGQVTGDLVSWAPVISYAPHAVVSGDLEPAASPF